MKKVKYMIIGLVLAVTLLVMFYLWYMQRPIFGRLPEGTRLARVQASSHYKNGAFQNLEATPQMAPGFSMLGVMWDFLFRKPKNVRPDKPINVVQTNLSALDKSVNQLVWLGHSSYYFTLDGVSYLVDPVFSKNASPIPGSNTAFDATYNYTADDIPAVDILLLSHDHFDHLDYETFIAIKGRVGKVICGLGVGAHLEHWGFPVDQIVELDWNEKVELDDQLTITATPARHFSGRSFKRNTSLFCSYVIKSEHQNWFIGGDSGYGTHFKRIGQQYGPFDFAVLENGQYNEAWRYIHTLPSELPKVIEDLGVKTVLPVHSAKFALAMHDWKEPLDKAYQLSVPGTKILMPPIGAVLNLSDSLCQNTDWWNKW